MHFGKNPQNKPGSSGYLPKTTTWLTNKLFTQPLIQIIKLINLALKTI